MKLFANIEYAKETDCKLDIYVPDEIKGFETIIWFHGGGLISGKKEDGKELALDFVKEGYAFVSVEYRMYPNAKFPEYIVDCAKAVAFVKKVIANYGGDEKRLYISGQSAGAWISLMLCLNERYLTNEGVNAQDICGWLIDSAQTTSHFNVLKMEQGEDKKAQRINEFAPLLYVSNKTSFTKMFLMFYENDMPCRYEQNLLFYKAILAFNKNANISYKVLKGTHCFGSTKRDENGEFEYVQSTLQCLKKWREDK